MMDLYRLKCINDHFGHHVGDVALTCVARGLRSTERPGLRGYRKGGDEFVILVAGEADVASTAEEIRAVLEAERVFLTEAEYVPVRVSIGGALIGPGTALEAAFTCADTAMYEVKQRRTRNRPRGAKPEVLRVVNS
jgi:diguanylate cyclase (GGDEF)-like protein